MKHLYTVLAALLITASATAQSISLSDTMWDLDLSEGLEFDEVMITNDGSTPLELGVSVHLDCYDPADGLKIQICLGAQCFEPVNSASSWEGTDSNPLLVLDPGQSSGEFSVHQFFVGTEGSEWVVTFYDRNNPTDAVDFMLDIAVCDQANNIAEAPELSVSAAYPNPANTTVNFDFEISASPVELQVFDLVGNLVKNTTLETSQGSAKLDVSDLNNGVYFYNLNVNGHRSEVKSLVVSH